jgi:hypothetical protein
MFSGCVEACDFEKLKCHDFTDGRGAKCVVPCAAPNRFLVVQWHLGAVVPILDLNTVLLQCGTIRAAIH